MKPSTSVAVLRTIYRISTLFTKILSYMTGTGQLTRKDFKSGTETGNYYGHLTVIGSATFLVTYSHLSIE